jgi:glucokinase
VASGAKLRGGIDLGGTKIQVVVVDAESKVLASARRPTPTTGGPAAVAAEMTGALNEALEDAGVEASKLQGVGVGSPGDVNAKADTVARAGNLPDWERPFELGQALTDALGTPVALGNDVGVATEA